MVISVFFIQYLDTMFEEQGTDTSNLAAGLSHLNIEGNFKLGFSISIGKKPLLVDKSTGITFRQYQFEFDLDEIVALITKTLSEPYSLYTYRYFIYNWPDLCLLVIRVSIYLFPDLFRQ